MIEIILKVERKCPELNNIITKIDCNHEIIINICVTINLTNYLDRSYDH